MVFALSFVEASQSVHKHKIKKFYSIIPILTSKLGTCKWEAASEILYLCAYIVKSILLSFL